MFRKQLLFQLVTFLILTPINSFAVSVKQTLDYSSARGFGDYTDKRIESSGWDSPFPFADANQIRDILFDFASNDSNYNSATGPTGGEPSAAIRVSHESGSFVPGNQNQIFDSTVQPDFAVLAAMLADGRLQVELHGNENFPMGGFSQPMELDLSSTLTITVEGSLGTVTQTKTFPQLPGQAGSAGRMRFENDEWNVVFPFSEASQISRIKIDFATTDPDFNSGVGPNGGDPGVGIQMTEELASLNRGIESFSLRRGSYDRFDAVAEMMMSNSTRAGVAGYENFTTFSTPMPLDQLSTLTITVTGVPEPSGCCLAALILLAGVIRWRQHS